MSAPLLLWSLMLLTTVYCLSRYLQTFQILEQLVAYSSATNMFNSFGYLGPQDWGFKSIICYVETQCLSWGCLDFACPRWLLSFYASWVRCIRSFIIYPWNGESSSELSLSFIMAESVPGVLLCLLLWRRQWDFLKSGDYFISLFLILC